MGILLKYLIHTSRWVIVGAAIAIAAMNFARADEPKIKSPICVSALKGEASATILRGTFVTLLDRISAMSERAATEHVYLLEDEVRTALYQFEGLARLFWAFGKNNKKEIEQILEITKALEDRVGRLALQQNLLKFAHKTEAPEQLIAFLDRENDTLWETTIIWMNKNGWFDGRAVHKLRKELSEIHWLDRDSEILEIKNAFAEQFKTDRKFIENHIEPMLEESGFNYQDLEEGTHEMRRRIRWLPLQVHALQGIIRLGTLPNQMSRPMRAVVDAALKTKHANVPTTLKGEITMSALPFLQVVNLVKEIGDIKDQGEMKFIIGQKLVECGLYKVGDKKSEKAALDLATRLVIKRYGDDNVKEKYRAQYEFYKQNNPLKVLQKELEE